MTPADPDYGIHNSRTPPEELLIFSILSRAILDLFGPVGLTSNQDEADTAKSDALMFLTQETGGWARRRKELCDAVGIDGDEMRARVIRVLEGDMMALSTYEGRGSLSQVDQARVLWKHEQGALERSRVANERLKAQRKVNEAAHPHTKSRPVKYIEARPKVMALLDRPRTIAELAKATAYSDGVVRTVLNKAIEKGEVEQNGSRFSLLLPQTAVAAEAA